MYHNLFVTVLEELFRLGADRMVAVPPWILDMEDLRKAIEASLACIVWVSHSPWTRCFRFL